MSSRCAALKQARVCRRPSASLRAGSRNRGSPFGSPRPLFPALRSAPARRPRGLCPRRAPLGPRRVFGSFSTSARLFCVIRPPSAPSAPCGPSVQAFSVGRAGFCGLRPAASVPLPAGIPAVAPIASFPSCRPGPEAEPARRSARKPQPVRGKYAAILIDNVPHVVHNRRKGVRPCLAPPNPPRATRSVASCGTWTRTIPPVSS